MQIISAPNITVHRTPMRSAMRPIRRPPKPTPNQLSDPASAGIERAPPSSAAIAFKATTAIHGAPNENPMATSATLATTQDCLVSIDFSIMRFRPGPASCVKHVPVDSELLAALEDAQFTNVTLTTFRPAPCFRIGETELRETKVACEKPLAECENDECVVVYKGPFLQVADDEQRTFRRGERVAIPQF